MTAATTRLDPRLAGYLTTNRDFLAPAVAHAVATLRLPAGAWVLDAGTGGGGALPPLARAVGSAGSVRAVDLNPAVIPLATAHVAQHGMTARVTVECADVLDVLAESATGPRGGFDAIWAADVVWPGTFADPAATVAAMVRALRPGGVLALFVGNYHGSVFLPGRPDLERQLRAASERRWRLPTGGPHHPDRRLAWLAAAGLEQVGMTVIPRVAFPVAVDRTARAYLESTVWPEMAESARACGAEVGMSDADLDELRALTDPGSRRYIVHEPGYHILHPTILATGRQTRGGRR